MNILFVCTGNTCRSYMAQELMKKKIKEEEKKGRLEKNLFKVSSAGLFAIESSKSSSFARQTLREDYKIKARTYRARQVTKEILQKQDLILTMTESHKENILYSLPLLEGKVYTLKEYVYGEKDNLDIQDPYGSDIEIYKKSGKEISKALDKLLEKILSKMSME